jgi:hypothetical protein
MRTGWARAVLLVVAGGVTLAACSSGGQSPTAAQKAAVGNPCDSGTAGAHHSLAGPPTTKAPPTTTTTTEPPATTSPPMTSAPPATALPTSGIQIGPGPQASYTVRPQSAPGSCHYTYVGVDPLPDPHCTPGAINPHVTQGNIDSTICQSGYTTIIRPPESITDDEKVASAAAYGYLGSLHTAEYDHLISLELGGDPNDPANLWVEPNDRPGATSTYNTKDTLENKLNSLVCSGQISLAVAQQAIATNWVAAYQTYDS